MTFLSKYSSKSCSFPLHGHFWDDFLRSETRKWEEKRVRLCQTVVELHGFQEILVYQKQAASHVWR